MLQGLVTDDNGNQILVRVDTVVVPGIGRNLFSVTTAAKKGNAAIFDYKTPKPEGLNIRATTERERRPLLVRAGLACGPIWRQGASNDGTGGWVIFMHRVWIFYASETALVSRSRGLSRTATFAPWRKLNSLLTPRQPITRSAGHSSPATGT